MKRGLKRGLMKENERVVGSKVSMEKKKKKDGEKRWTASCDDEDGPRGTAVLSAGWRVANVLRRKRGRTWKNFRHGRDGATEQEASSLSVSLALFLTAWIIESRRAPVPWWFIRAYSSCNLSSVWLRAFVLEMQGDRNSRFLKIFC